MSANTIEIRPLLAVLRKASAGAQITDDELQAASWQADGKLEDMCSQAWKRLRWWSGDDDIRTKDAEYAKATREYLEWLLDEITKEAKVRGVAID